MPHPRPPKEPKTPAVAPAKPATPANPAPANFSYQEVYVYPAAEEEEEEGYSDNTGLEAPQVLGQEANSSELERRREEEKNLKQEVRLIISIIFIILNFTLFSACSFLLPRSNAAP